LLGLAAYLSRLRRTEVVGWYIYAQFQSMIVGVMWFWN